ncbi:MAG: histidine kinase [Bacteroidota bacterium]
MMNRVLWKILSVSVAFFLWSTANAQLVDTLALESDIRSYSQQSSSESIRERLNALAKQQPSTALRLSKMAAAQTNEPNELVPLFNITAFALLAQANYSQAEEFLTKAETLATTHQLSEYLPSIYLNWGNLYWKTLDIEAGLAVADRCASVAGQLKDSLYIAKSQVLKGWLLRRQGKNEAAFSNFSAALEYFENNGLESQAASTLNGMAATAYMLEKLSDAADYWIRASHFAAKEGLSNLEQSVLSNLGYLYLRLEQYPKSRAAFFQALHLAERRGDLNGKVHVSHNLTEFFQQNNQPDSARIFGQMTLDLGSQIGDYVRMAGAHLVLADLDMAEEQWRAAEVHTKEAVELAEKGGDIYSKGYGLFQWGQLKNQSGALQAALTYLKEALAIFKETSEMSWQTQALTEMASVYEKLNQPQLALEVFQESVALQDSIKEKEHLQKILAIEQQFTLEKKEEEIAYLAKENNLLIANKQKNHYIIAALIFSLLLGAVIFMLAYRQRKLRLEKGLAEVKQKLLRQQMNPHFIFNTLNSVQNQFLKGDTETSVLLMGKYSKLMRLVLNNSNETFVSIYDELELLRLYLDLEQLRTNAKFEYIINISEEVDIYNTSLPSMITQIFVENAIWHGVAQKSEKGTITLGITRQGNNIVFSVADDGVGRKYSLHTKTETQKEHRSLGTQLVKSRIQQINRKFARNIRILIEDLEGLDGSAKGTKVKLIFEGMH